MSKKKHQTYDLSGLKAIRVKLERHERPLVAKIADLVGQPGFNAACELRDLAQFLVTTRLILGIDGPLATCEKLCELSGKPQMVTHLDDCGLDLEAK